jgi:hypothetical protein
MAVGFGPIGANAAVEFFECDQVKVTFDGVSNMERGLNLGHVMLEPTPLGLRVYKDEPE